MIGLSAPLESIRPRCERSKVCRGSLIGTSFRSKGWKSQKQKGDEGDVPPHSRILISTESPTSHSADSGNTADDRKSLIIHGRTSDGARIVQEIVDDEFERSALDRELETTVDTRHEVRGRKVPDAGSDGASRHLSASTPSDE